MKPKINIVYNFVEGPWGGANQFLKALRDYFRQIRVYSEMPENADVIIFNSHHCFEDVIRIKKTYPHKIFIHRIDGPLSLARGRESKILDERIFQANQLLADGTVFQSNWSRIKNYEHGMKKNAYETVIINAPDPNIFNRKHVKQFELKKVKLAASSWSTNVRKGFDIYKFLDENLDFNKYEMTFVGNSPVAFKNIKLISPVLTKEFANILKRHDIFLVASEVDACSNTLIEALHCGLPAVARDSASHPEIIGAAGEFFKGKKDVINAIQKVSHDHTYYKQRIKIPTLDEVGQRYFEFAQTIYEDYSKGNYHPKLRTLLGIARIKIKTAIWKISDKIQLIIKLIRKRRRISL